MAARVRVVKVHVELVDHDHGHWCNRCLLATGVRAWVAVWLNTTMHLQIRLVCTECGGTDIEVNPDGHHC